MEMKMRVAGSTQSGSLEDFMFRRYSPVQGRWISPDPAGLAAVDPTNPQTWNRYVYVGNNPLSAVDSLGLWFQGYDDVRRKCQMDGWNVPCAQVVAALQSDFGAQCPNNDCSVFQQTYRGTFGGSYSLVAAANGFEWINNYNGDELNSDAAAEQGLADLGSGDGSGGAMFFGVSGGGQGIGLRLFGQPAQCDSDRGNRAYLQFTNVPPFPNGVNVTNVDVRTKGPVVSAYAGLNLIFGSSQNPFPLSNNPSASGLGTWVYAYLASGNGSLLWTANYSINGQNQPALKGTFNVKCQTK